MFPLEELPDRAVFGARHAAFDGVDCEPVLDSDGAPHRDCETFPALVLGNGGSG